MPTPSSLLPPCILPGVQAAVLGRLGDRFKIQVKDGPERNKVMAVKPEKLVLVRSGHADKGAGSQAAESEASNGTHDASDGQGNHGRRIRFEGARASTLPAPEEFHSDSMLRHILASSEAGSDGGSFRYCDALRAQLEGHYRMHDKEPPANGEQSESAGETRLEADAEEEHPSGAGGGSAGQHDAEIEDQNSLQRRQQLRRASSHQNSSYMRNMILRHTFTASHMDRFHALVKNPESSIKDEQDWQERIVIFDRAGEEICIHHPSVIKICSVQNSRRQAEMNASLNRKTKVYAVREITSCSGNDFNYAQLSISTRSIKLCLNQFGEKLVIKKGERTEVLFEDPAHKEKFLSIFRAVNAMYDAHGGEEV